MVDPQDAKLPIPATYNQRSLPCVGFRWDSDPLRLQFGIVPCETLCRVVFEED